MDKQNNTNNQDDSWIDHLFDDIDPLAEIGPDEQAVHSAGLIHPKDRELEEILSEDWSGTKANGSTQRFVSAQEKAEEPKPAVQSEKKPEAKKKNTDTAKPTTPAPSKPKSKKGEMLAGIPHIFSTLIWLAVIVIIGASLGRWVWNCCSDLMAFGKPDQKITITITDKEVQVLDKNTKEVDIDAISQKLGDAGLIKYPALFKLFATLTNKDEHIIAGTFNLNSYFDYNAMINAMSYHSAAREIVTVLIPEGYNCAQIFALLEEHEVCTAKELEEYAANGELDDYWFLENVKRGSEYCLEGYLFPDTYDFYVNDDPRRVLEKFLDDFDYRFTDLMKEDFEILKNRFSSINLTVHDVVTMASIIEKETSSDTESYDIASVFYNRLANSASYPTLDSDATVHYAIGDYFGQIEELTYSHLQSSSPYNTRKARGLPPGAICNPGRSSLYAALDPNDTNYYYFVYNAKEGHHIFAKTYNEHLKNVDSLE